MFCDVINQFPFQQLNTVPSNVKGNMLDLEFTNAPELFSSINEYSVEISSDHKFPNFSISLPNLSSDKCDIRKVFNYKAASWDDLRQALQQVDLCEIIRHDSDIDHAWKNWLSRVMGIVNDKVPTVTINHDQSGPPWIVSQVGQLINLK